MSKSKFITVMSTNRDTVMAEIPRKPDIKMEACKYIHIVWALLPYPSESKTPSPLDIDSFEIHTPDFDPIIDDPLQWKREQVRRI